MTAPTVKSPAKVIKYWVSATEKLKKAAPENQMLKPPAGKGRFEPQAQSGYHNDKKIKHDHVGGRQEFDGRRRGGLPRRPKGG